MAHLLRELVGHDEVRFAKYQVARYRAQQLRRRLLLRASASTSDEMPARAGAKNCYLQPGNLVRPQVRRF
jgi:hypothetical protein